MATVEAKVEKKAEEPLDLLKKIIQGKRASGDVVKEDTARYDAEWEKSGNFTWPQVFCHDTPIMTLFHPGHLGYDFNYFKGGPTWKGYCWDSKTNGLTQSRANYELLQVAEEIRKLGYVVWLLLPSHCSFSALRTYVHEHVDFDLSLKKLDELKFDELFACNELILAVFNFDLMKSIDTMIKLHPPTPPVQSDEEKKKAPSNKEGGKKPPSPLLKQIIQGKIEAHDMVATGDLGLDREWARNPDKIHLGVYAKDTPRMTLLHPGHLGYAFKYFMSFNHPEHTDRCWDKYTDRATQYQAYHKLMAIAGELKTLGYQTWMLLPNRSDEGYLSTFVHRFTDEATMLKLMLQYKDDELFQGNEWVIAVFDCDLASIWIPSAGISAFPSALLQKIIKGKVAANDPVDEDLITRFGAGWYDVVKESAHGRGIHIGCFGDTSDKFVLHPGHLGYKFNYFWGRGRWAAKSCWDAEYKDFSKGNMELMDVAEEIHKQGHKVWVCSPAGDGGGCLFSHVYVYKGLETAGRVLGEHDDLVLFVFVSQPQVLLYESDSDSD